MLLARGLAKFGGWFNTALGLFGLCIGAWLGGALFLSLGLVVLTQAYRVTHVFGVRLPWVKGEDVSPPG
jgi:hypothetical protein